MAPFIRTSTSSEMQGRAAVRTAEDQCAWSPHQRELSRVLKTRRAMGIRHFLLLLIYLDPLNVFCTLTAKRPKPPPKKTPKPKELNGTTVAPSASTQRITEVRPVLTHETCLGYYDVSGQFDKEFECNNTDHRYCCGSCYLRFCCQFKGNRLDQRTCKNYHKPDWVKTVPPSPVPTGDTYDPSMDQTNTAVYITCGVIAFIIVLGVSTKVAYDKATQPPQEMNIHRWAAHLHSPLLVFWHQMVVCIFELWNDWSHCKWTG